MENKVKAVAQKCDRLRSAGSDRNFLQAQPKNLIAHQLFNYRMIN
ncbi:hypothetical protein [Nostoc sp.]